MIRKRSKTDLSSYFNSRMTTSPIRALSIDLIHRFGHVIRAQYNAEVEVSEEAVTSPVVFVSTEITYRSILFNGSTSVFIDDRFMKIYESLDTRTNDL